MKKFWSLMLVALVTLGAAACTETEESVEKSQEAGLSFSAEIAVDTRAVTEKGEDNVWKTTWTEGDTLMVGEYEFTFNGEKFTCNAEGVNSIVGQEVTITGENGGSDDGDKAYKIAAESVTFEKNMTVTLESALSFFYFEYNGSVTFNASEDIFKFKGEMQNTIEFASVSGKHLFAFYPTGNETTLSYSIGGVKVKETTINFAAGKVYNLGTLTEAESVYLVPNSDWKSADAWFVAHFYNSTDGFADVTMTDQDSDGKYECSVPAGMESVIFCRMNPEYTEFGWNDETITNRVWNQTSEETIGAKPDNYYYIIDWTTGIWGTAEGYVIPDVEAGVATEWALVGVFSDWTDKTFLTTTKANVVVLSNVTMKAATGFLVRKPSTGWADKYGAGDVNYLKANHYITTAQNGGDMCLEADGSYDIYFNTTTKDIYVMSAGQDYNTATKQTVSGKEPVQEEPEVTANMLYLKPNSNWLQSNARFAAYFFGGTPGEVWVNMADSDSDGIYEVNIPEGYNYGCSVIFCRMNPGTTGNNWNNKWNQTTDLTAPTDGKNLYTVKDGTWDKGGGTWSVK